MKEDICQIYIPAATGVLPPRAFYQTRLNGRYHAKIAGIAYTDNTTTHDHRVISIESNCFRMPFGSKLLFANKAAETHGNPSSSWPFELEVMGGGVDIDIKASIDYDNTGNNKFFFCIVTLLVSPLE